MSQGRCADLRFGTIVSIIGGCTGAAVTGLALYLLCVGHFGADQIRYVIALLYAVVLGLLIILAEFRVEGVLKWFAFLMRPLGLGLFYFFVGGLILGDSVAEIIIAVFMCVIGLIYVCFAICCQGDTRATAPQVVKDPKTGQAKIGV